MCPPIGAKVRSLLDDLVHSRQSLDLSNEKVSAAELLLLAEALQTYGRSVRAIKFACSEIGAKGAAIVASLLQSESMKELSMLNLSSNRLGAQGAAALANVLWGATMRAPLHTLDLSCNFIGDIGVTALAIALRSESLTAPLRDLDLSYNDIGDEGATALALALQSRSMKIPLEVLNLHGNRIGEKGANELATALCKKSTTVPLSRLDLSYNPIGHKGVAAFAVAICCEAMTAPLKELDLCSTHCGPDGAIAIAEALQNQAMQAPLSSIDLSCNDVGNEGVRALASALQSKSMTAPLCVLNVSSNRIGNEGVKALATALQLTTAPLCLLDLSCNAIGDEGVAALADALRSESMTAPLAVLDLSCNVIGNEGAQALMSVVQSGSLKVRLDVLNLGDNQIEHRGAGPLGQSAYMTASLVASAETDSTAAPSIAARIRGTSAGVTLITEFESTSADPSNSIHLATAFGRSDVVEGILEKSPDSPRVRSGNLGRLPLHTATASGSTVEVVKLLLAAAPEAVELFDDSDDPCLPLHLAVANNCSEEVVALVLHAWPESARVRTRTEGKLPLHVAAEYGASVGVMKLLLAAAPEAARALDYGQEPRLPIQYALSGSDNAPAITLLLEAFPDAVACSPKANSIPLSTNSSESKKPKKRNYSVSTTTNASLTTLPSVSLQRHSICRLHLCGHSYAGKTTLRRSFKTNIENGGSTSEVTEVFLDDRTKGVEVDKCMLESVALHIHDYGGSSWLHVNYSYFMRMERSVFVIVVPLVNLDPAQVPCTRRAGAGAEPRHYTSGECKGLAGQWLNFAVSAAAAAGEVVPCAVVVNEFTDDYFTAGEVNAHILSVTMHLKELCEEWTGRGVRIVKGGPIFVKAALNDNRLCALLEHLIKAAVPDSCPDAEMEPVDSISVVVNIVLQHKPNITSLGIATVDEVNDFIMRAVYPVRDPSEAQMHPTVVIRTKLERMGIIVPLGNHCAYDDENDKLYLCDVSILGEAIFGTIISAFDRHATDVETLMRSGCEVVHMADYAMTITKLTAVIDHGAQAYGGNLIDGGKLANLLRLSKLAIPIRCRGVSEQMWLPTFTERRMTIEDRSEMWKILQSPHVRTVGRRYRLTPSSGSICGMAPLHFPPGYIASVFYDICSVIPAQISVDLRCNYVRVTAEDDQAVVTVFVVVDSTSMAFFDVIVCATGCSSYGDNAERVGETSSVWQIAKSISGSVMKSYSRNPRCILLDEFGLREKRDATSGIFVGLICDTQVPLSHCTAYIWQHQPELHTAFFGRGANRGCSVSEMKASMRSQLDRDAICEALQVQLRQPMRVVGIPAIIASTTEWLTAHEIELVLMQRQRIANDFMVCNPALREAFDSDLSRLRKGLKVCAEAEKFVAGKLRETIEVSASSAPATNSLLQYHSERSLRAAYDIALNTFQEFSNQHPDQELISIARESIIACAMKCVITPPPSCAESFLQLETRESGFEVQSMTTIENLLRDLAIELRKHIDDRHSLVLQKFDQVETTLKNLTMAVAHMCNSVTDVELLIHVLETHHNAALQDRLDVQQLLKDMHEIRSDVSSLLVLSSECALQLSPSVEKFNEALSMLREMKSQISIIQSIQQHQLKVLAKLDADKNFMPHLFCMIPEVEKKKLDEAARTKVEGNNWFKSVCESLKDRLWKRTRLVFVCPVKLETVKCGKDGNGYVIDVPTKLLRSAVPFLKIGLLLLKVALATQGAGCLVPNFTKFIPPSYTEGVVSEILSNMESAAEDTVKSIEDVDIENTMLDLLKLMALEEGVKPEEVNAKLSAGWKPAKTGLILKKATTGESAWVSKPAVAEFEKRGFAAFQPLSGRTGIQTMRP